MKLLNKVIISLIVAAIFYVSYTIFFNEEKKITKKKRRDKKKKENKKINKQIIFSILIFICVWFLLNGNSMMPPKDIELDDENVTILSSLDSSLTINNEDLPDIFFEFK